jgi:two-component system, NtrC family, sensor kinase
MDAEQFDKIHLLVVDDEADFRNTLTKRLKKRGITAHQAESGETCLRILEQHPMDVVVLDVKMPGMNGIEVLHGIKRDHIQTEVILLTGHYATQDGITGIKSGAFDYLSKPVEFEHLLEKIRQAFEKKLRAAERQREAEYKAKIEQQMIATERLTALGTLAAGVAHEINNPLAIINEAAGYMRSLLKKPELAQIPRKQDFEKALDKIRKGIKRTRTITHQLLSGVRKQEPVLAYVHLDELVDETIELVRKEAADKEITLTRETHRTADGIWIDPNKVRQILINLLTNAIYATQRQGSITVRIDGNADDIILAVSDTGKGIPKEYMDKIFEPFFSDKPPGEGTGLGLFVTREIVEKLGGAIDVQSRVGVGTTITLNIPTQKIKRQVQE